MLTWMLLCGNGGVNGLAGMEVMDEAAAAEA